MFVWLHAYYANDWWTGAHFVRMLVSLAAIAGVLWSWRRQRRAVPSQLDARPAPQTFNDQMILSGLSLIGLGVVLYLLLRGRFFDAPWKELLLACTVLWSGTLYFF